jgi:dolichyl-phosphate-mannose--protein O-mannosyl transferase
MAKIKLEDNNVVIYYSEVSGGLYDAVKNYKIDLTNRKHYYLKPTEEQEIEWGLNKNEEANMIDNLKKETWFHIENCYNVIYSYEQSGNIKQVEKNKKFLENNKIILEFLKNYSVE